MKITYKARKFKKYEDEDVWNPGEFVEVNEKYFNQMVVDHRNQWEIKYYENYQEFINKETGIKMRRYYA